MKWDLKHEFDTHHQHQTSRPGLLLFTELNQKLCSCMVITKAMLNNTTYSSSYKVSFPCDGEDSYIYAANFASAIIIAVLSPVAVAGNALILAAIWNKTFSRTPFHIIVSGLAFTDLCAGLIAQPVNAATILLYTINVRRTIERTLPYVIFEIIADASATYFISITLLILTLMSVERWLHMSLVTSRHACFVATVFLLIPIPIVVFRSLETVKPGSIGSMFYITIMVLMLSCFLTTLVAYFNVLRIIRIHQLQVQANQPSRHFVQPAINLAKFKKSVVTILYVLALFCFCFLPFIISVGVYVRVGLNPEVTMSLSFSLVLLFLSSSLNPCVYLWRMKDVRNGVKKIFCSNS